jgi:Holliday junction resolvase
MVMSKKKGNRVEREIVNIFKESNWEAERAWGSNGRAMGEHEEVDIKAEKGEVKLLVQVKARKAIADYIKPNTDIVDIQVVKEDRKEPLVVLPLYMFLQFVNTDDYYRK